MADTPRPLTDLQQRFVHEYLVDLNALRATIRAGYSAKSAAYYSGQLMKDARIRAAIDAKQQAHLRKLDISLDRVLREVARIAFLDIGCLYCDDGHLKPISEWPAGARRAIASIEHETRWDGRGDDASSYTVTKVKAWDKVASLTLLLRRLGGLPAETRVHTGPNGGPIQHQHARSPEERALMQATDEELETLRQASILHKRLLLGGPAA